MKANDGMRGSWHFTGQYWFCDCFGGSPVLQIGIGQGGALTGRSHSPNVSRCKHCGVLRPLKRDRPKLDDYSHQWATGEERENILEKLK